MYSDLRFSPAPKIHLAITSTQIQFTLSMACTPTSWRESVPKTGTDSILSYLARGALWLASELKEKQVKGMKVWGVTGWSFMMAAVEVLRDIRTFILETSQAWRTHLHWKQVFEQIFNARWYGNLHTNTKISEKERQWLVELSREIREDWILLYLGGGVGELRALIKETVRILTRNGIQTFRFMLTCFTTELQRTRCWSRAFLT